MTSTVKIDEDLVQQVLSNVSMSNLMMIQCNENTATAIANREPLCGCRSDVKFCGEICIKGITLFRTGYIFKDGNTALSVMREVLSRAINHK